VHVAVFGKKAEWTGEQLQSTVRGGPADACWSAEDRLVIRLADQLHDTNDVDDGLWRDLAAHFAADQLIELVVLAGLYHGVSYLSNAMRVQHEAFAPGFP
jgi:alkylhydroperoxidase family enzyme